VLEVAGYKIQDTVAPSKKSIMLVILMQLQTSQTRLAAVISVSEFGLTKSESVERISAINPTESQHLLHLIEHC